MTEQRSEPSRPNAADPGSAQNLKSWAARVYPAELERREAALVTGRRKRAEGSEGAAEAGNPSRLPEDTIGLALSGGGIRSATFCLGVLQSISRVGLLGKIDFLSTVSGGGYIGSFLGRMFTRDWGGNGGSRPVTVVEEKLVDGESEPMRWLRNNGRYLSPNRAGDAWLAVAVILRNWLSLVTVLLTLAFAVFSGLTLVRSALWKISSYPEFFEAPLLRFAGNKLWWSPWVAPALLVLAAAIVPVWAYWLSQVTWSDKKQPLRFFHKYISVVTTLVIVLGSAYVMVASRSDFFPVSLTLNSIAIALFVGGLLALVVVVVLRGVSGDDRYLFRNRLSRSLALFLQVVVLLAVIAVLDTIGQTAYAVLTYKEGLLPPLKMLFGLTGLAAVVAFGQKITALLQTLPRGRIFRLPAAVLAGLIGGALAFVFLVAVSVAVHAVAWGGGVPTPKIGDDRYNPGRDISVHFENSQDPKPAESGDAIAGTSPGTRDGQEPVGANAPDTRGLLIAFGVAAILSLLIGQILAFFNLSSLHAFYAARLSRAYLGASNFLRWGRSQYKDDESQSPPAGQLIGDPIKGDDCYWDEYRPWESGGPLHIVNMTLNETVSGKSQVEYRDRKGLIMAAGPCGLSVGRTDHGLWGRYPTGDETEEAGEEYLTWMTPIGAKDKEFHALGLATEHQTDPKYGEPNRCERAKLGRYVAISGAAITTGLGSQTSFGTSLLMGLLNVRLGYWWTSGVSHSQRKKAGACSPQRLISRFETFIGRLLPLQTALVAEFTARFHGPVHRRWYLSDGGHYENTAVYELLRRRVPLIIACDCGCDRDFQFQDIANLARKARIDFGAELEFLDDETLAGAKISDDIRERLGTPTDFQIAVTDTKDEKVASRAAKHAMLAWVDFEGKRFSDRLTADRTARTGSLILFLKPSLTGDEPIDVLRYQSGHPDFPNETTADQFFDEAQWESYRKLGEHIADEFLSRDVFGALWPASADC